MSATTAFRLTALAVSMSFATVSTGLAGGEGGKTMASDETSAIERTSEQFNLLLSGLHIENPLDKSVFLIGPLEPSDFRVLDETEDGWTVVHEPLVGVAVNARVSKSTGLVQFDALTVSVE